MPSKAEEKKGASKVGVYICHCGGNISDHVDVAAVAEKAGQIPGVSVVHTNMFMCSDPGQELIQEDIRSGKIDRVVVASCAPSLHELTFRNAIKRAGMNPYQYEHANIREQDSWVHHGDAATAKAATLVAAAVAKAKSLSPLDPIRVDAHRHATVIGGGIAGLRAALDLSRQGTEVALVEQSPFLGGQTANLDKLFPTGESAADRIREMADEVCSAPRITVYSCSRIVSSEGYVGNFRVTIRRQPPESQKDMENLGKAKKAGAGPGGYVPFVGYLPSGPPTRGEDRVVDTGAIVFATGFETYVPRSGEFGFAEHPEVITLPELIRQMALAEKTDDRLVINGRPIRQMALIHCVGSRQIPGIHEPDENGRLNEYCSRTCCAASLQAAVEVRTRHPKTHVLEYYRDIRTYGRGQEDFYEQASGKNVLFFRYEAESPPKVEPAPDGGYPLKVTVTDSLTFGEEVSALVDLVVLAVGMVPAKIADLVEMMKLPVGADGFLQEVHPKLRPVELANTGILLAGTCQAPMDITESCAAAQAASVKTAALLSKGYVELDPFVAAVDTGRCTGSGACVEACPVEAVKMESVVIDGAPADRATVNPALCTGCGVCVAACPANAIDVAGWTLTQYEEMVDAIAAA
ncbi:MAG: CoB--CoM heterodisulfide reductase iron-sulfur subunit A family protein [Desulfobacterales bacterium]|jgi:heterodisulfide reductase subunit A